ncbi:MAG: hypothetical protein H7A51_04015 [Akkermansiaceae bacterium]|nr:hypothetical protein [Akkermansiaceae bacterium]
MPLARSLNTSTVFSVETQSEHDGARRTRTAPTCENKSKPSASNGAVRLTQSTKREFDDRHSWSRHHGIASGNGWCNRPRGIVRSANAKIDQRRLGWNRQGRCGGSAKSFALTGAALKVGIGGALAGGAAAVAGGVKAINAAADFEQTKVAFTTLIGDVQRRPRQP